MTGKPTALETALLADLNPIQLEAATRPGGPLLILAGAGSGKTRVLTRRIAWLIQQRGVAPDRILAVTFTNKAAGEMRERVATLLGTSVRGLWIGTFHSICLRWLRRHPTEAGYRPGLSVHDADDQLTLLRRLLKEEGFDHTPRRARELQAIISRSKNRAEGPAELAARARGPAERLAARFYERYQDSLQRQNAADFDDLLFGAHRLLRDHPEIAEHYSGQFEHILVDEYQDTNHVQFLLVERLAHTHGNIFVVGDDDQSIYGWRGAEIRNILDYQRSFPEAEVFTLEQNYRSTTAILAFANAAIARNKGRYAKTLWTERAAGEAPEFVLAGDEDEEAAEVAQRLLAAVAGGRRRREIAIFYRTHAQSRPLEDALLRQAIPYVIVGGIYFYARREVKDLLSYLRVLVNPRDETSLRRALSVPRRGIGERSFAELLAAAREAGADPVELAARGGPESLRGRARKALREFGELILSLRGRIDEPPERILSELVAEVAYGDYLREQGGDWEERFANVQELIEGARLFSSQEATGGVPEYLDQVSLMTSVDTAKAGADAVTLMTAHNAKGLEFPQVFLVGLEEGLFPHVSALEDQAEMEEERRLFYVACTRAMDELVLSASQVRRRFSSGAGGVSRFLLEVPRHLYREAFAASLGGGAGSWPTRAAGARWGRASGGRGRRAGGNASEREWGDTAQVEDHCLAEEHPLVGRRVYHATFGDGLVTGVEGRGDQARITVRFSGGRTRKVLKNYLEWEA
ncbi:MAG: UvrD-helicase domain-containing protein [Candidatus Eisenbacteria sp.]|nr:UvrD-helicase domain-containing protein [Candidatus Eisenbacteria bacterium]